MNEQDNYKEINKQLWNQKTSSHVDSEFYNNAAFLAGKSSLNSIEIELLGDVTSKKILHLQCHFGQDTLSLARLGAHVTGIDLSDKAIEVAKEMNKQLNLDAEFICADVYDTPEELNEKFDIVYTSYGTIGWLPDLNRWAQVIQRCLKPNGKLVFVEFHPIVWMFDYDFSKFQYSYFNIEPIIETQEGTYADRNANISAKEISWNHPLAEVFQGLLNNGLKIESFEEYNYSPYNCFNNTVEFELGKFQIKSLEGKIPMLYSIVASK
ncbi:class I SAM-dependent methyltransferase [Sphingobacterium cellulitidis]|uniref:Type 12 methyltransferase n=1 Tax=Sphingobacterium cellulitidis TaxID=1768011 RepID=A0A8H9G3C8_9SPHI|nr:class I SAM-dependent methyltransferase [Sphingobacterium soli]MBA8986041.1 2-polyprenyl-3-methyl-5-hydroxy-6-metoxy-1,4-benzoquinol methylase [Sphingobacterium soli]GGE35200.1 type 12 methyltransferase [Sphingobacterium soli]